MFTYVVERHAEPCRGVWDGVAPISFQVHETVCTEAVGTVEEMTGQGAGYVTWGILNPGAQFY